MNTSSKGTLHHVELWVPDIERAKQEWGWILARLGYSAYLSSREYERTAPGLNHLAFQAGSQRDVDALVVEGPRYGWMQLFQDKYPHAGGPDHYAAYLFNSDGFEIELVAAD